MTCFLPPVSMKRQVSSSTEADTICSLEEEKSDYLQLNQHECYLSWVFGKQSSMALISRFKTLRQAILPAEFFVTDINET